jgi:SAM-dependent methyltransferase
MGRPMPPVPAISNNTVDAQFQQMVRKVFPATYEFDRRYVEHEFAHIGKLFETGVCPVASMQVLEFGCNIGATSIVLAHHGASVTAVDVNAEYVELARLNALRYGLADRIQFDVVRPGEPLPFGTASFDVVTCNSVLEYVDPQLLPGAQREMDRVLRPGGLLLVFGTSNRLWPIEAHSGRWLVNYVPRAIDQMRWQSLPRGVWPGTLRRGFGREYDDVLAGWKGARRYVELKREMGTVGWRLAWMRLAATALAVSPWSLGLMMPYATALLRKRARA